MSNDQVAKCHMTGMLRFQLRDVHQTLDEGRLKVGNCRQGFKSALVKRAVVGAVQNYLRIWGPECKESFRPPYTNFKTKYIKFREF